MQKFKSYLNKKFNPRAAKQDLVNLRKIASNSPSDIYMDNGISTSKYTVITFFPLNLMEQFSKLANVYFLFIGFMQMVKSISISEGQPVIFFPLCVVIAISMGKDIIEDLKRHQSDSKENNDEFEVYRNGQFVKCPSLSIQVGEILRVKKGEHFPADVLCIYSSGKKGEALIETKNLDGETNLKKKIAPKISNNLTIQDFAKQILLFEYEAPNPYLYKFNGKLKVKSQQNSEEVAVNDSNFILRGCSLQNTEMIYGLVSYTGHETKIMLNSVKARPKKSKVEVQMNGFIGLIFYIQIFICFVTAIIAAILSDQIFNDFGYLQISEDDTDKNFMLNFLTKWGTWILIFTNFVPISLLVTLEMVKFFQGKTISSDRNTMFIDPDDPKHFSQASVMSSNLNEELGQVQYVFSDKTGTLTSNVMKYKCVTINGISYGENRDMTNEEVQQLPAVKNVDFRDRSLFKELEDTKSPNYSYICEFLTMLAVCHTVITELDSKTQKIEYNASSPDELALVYFAKLAGMEFTGIDENENMSVQFKGKVKTYKLLHVLEFNSTRKRMSVIVKSDSNQIILYTKGADSIIQKRMAECNEQTVEKTWGNLQRYAQQGLRTLLCAKRVIKQKEYDDWNAKYYVASTSLDEREKKMEALQEVIEQNLEMIGATAIEDMLQDQVGETISVLKQAGIKVWVLTGDKVETAINIGYSCKLLSDDQEQLIVDGETEQQVIDSIDDVEKKIDVIKLEDNDISKQTPIALVLTGDCLIPCMKNDRLVKKIMEIANQCEVVLACRVSPKQKQEIVAMVRKAKPDVTTLAIGDGANDVNMITEAHVGIGIRGKEGHQAARASDFAIGEFKILRNLLLYHGRECYRRNTVLICYNFYKNMLLVIPQLWYGFVNGFSGTSLYDPYIYQLYNMCYTSIPIVLYAIFDVQFPQSELIKMPLEYSQGMHSLLFNKRQFITWLVNGFWQAAVCCWVCYLGMELACSERGRMFFFASSGNASFGASVIIGNLKILTFSYTHTVMSMLCIFGSILFYLSNHIIISVSNKGYDLWQTFFMQIKSSSFWLSNFLILTFIMSLEFFWSYYRYGQKYPEKFYNSKMQQIQTPDKQALIGPTNQQTNPQDNHLLSQIATPASNTPDVTSQLDNRNIDIGFRDQTSNPKHSIIISNSEKIPVSKKIKQNKMHDISKSHQFESNHTPIVTRSVRHQLTSQYTGYAFSESERFTEARKNNYQN